MSGVFYSFLASGTALASSAMMQHLTQNTTALRDSGMLTCVPNSADGNCVLQGSYGLGVMITSLLSALLNGLLFFVVLRHWKMSSGDQMLRKKKMFHITISLLVIIVGFATAVGGYNFYVQQNFGSEIANGGMGDNCVALSGFAGCDSLSGSTGTAVYTLNIINIVSSGIFMIYVLNGAMTSRHLLNFKRPTTLQMVKPKNKWLKL